MNTNALILNFIVFCLGCIVGVIGISFVQGTLVPQPRGEYGEEVMVNDTASSTDTTAQPQQKPKYVRTFTVAEVAKHNSNISCYISVGSSVYDVTKWIDKHPGAGQPVIAVCGTDASSAVTSNYAAQPWPISDLSPYKIGALRK